MAEIIRDQPSSAGSGSWALAPRLLAHMPDQRVLSDRVKAAIKTALATVLAYGVALSMDWEHAYWAAFAVAFCTLSTVGESLNKGLLRLIGTVFSLSRSGLLHPPCLRGHVIQLYRPQFPNGIVSSVSFGN